MPCPPFAARAPLRDDLLGSIHSAFDSRIHSAFQFAIKVWMSVAVVRRRAVAADPQPALQFATRASSPLPSRLRALGLAICTAPPIGRARPNLCYGQNLPHNSLETRTYVLMSW